MSEKSQKGFFSLSRPFQQVEIRKIFEFDLTKKKWKSSFALTSGTVTIKL